MKKLRSIEGKGFTQSHMAYWAGIPTQACPGSWASSFGPDSPVLEANPIHGGLLRPWKIKKKIRVTYLGPSLPFFLLFSLPGFSARLRLHTTAVFAQFCALQIAQALPFSWPPFLRCDPGKSRADGQGQVPEAWKSFSSCQGKCQPL